MNSRDKLIHIQQALEVEQSAAMPDLQHTMTLKGNLMDAYKEEESFWSQKSRDRWLEEGDQNTQFFHVSVKASRKRKRLDFLVDSKGKVQRL